MCRVRSGLPLNRMGTRQRGGRGDHPAPWLSLYVALIASIAVGGLLLSSLRWGVPAFLVAGFFWALHAIAFTASVDVPIGRPSTSVRPQTLTLSTGFLILLTAAFVLEPSSAMLAAFLPVFDIRSAHRPPPRKIIFNSSQEAICFGAVCITFRFLEGLSGAGVWTAPLAAMGAASVGVVLNTSLVGMAVALDQHWRLADIVRRLLWVAPHSLAFAIVALLVAFLVSQYGLMAVIFLFAPLIVVRHARRGKVELDQAHRSTLRAFARAVELKDRYTYRHSERVAEIVVELSKRLGVQERSLQSRFYGALLHDIGKVVVSAEILSKPSKLTFEEFELVKTHPSVGAEVAQQIGFLVESVPEILLHHERLDGSGYPFGLVGEAVPMAARILGVADTFEALTSNRPYRLALAVEDALEEIRRGTGTLFDPDVVIALEQAVRDGGTPMSLPATVSESRDATGSSAAANT